MNRYLAHTIIANVFIAVSFVANGLAWIVCIFFAFLWILLSIFQLKIEIRERSFIDILIYKNRLLELEIERLRSKRKR